MTPRVFSYLVVERCRLAGPRRCHVEYDVTVVVTMKHKPT